jgi:hypothetical protein
MNHAHAVRGKNISNAVESKTKQEKNEFWKINKFVFCQQIKWYVDKIHWK